jgi:signal transduction histidine kinase
MLALVNNLLDISVIESGNLDLEVSPTCLKSLLIERIRIHREMARKKNIRFIEKYSELPKISFDRNKMAQVIDNLLGNALKFSPVGTNVTVSLNRDSTVAMVSVQDEGSGIPEEDQVRIFGEFQKSRARSTGGEKSTGLGLAIAKKIVEAHGGTLRVKSRTGWGSTFTFTLPLGNFDDGNQKTESHNCG